MDFAADELIYVLKKLRRSILIFFNVQVISYLPAKISMFDNVFICLINSVLENAANQLKYYRYFDFYLSILSMFLQNNDNKTDVTFSDIIASLTVLQKISF